MYTKITLAVALLLGLTSATRVTQYSARYNPVSQYQQYQNYYGDDDYDQGYYDDADVYEEEQPDYSYFYRPQMRAEIQLHLANALTDQGFWDNLAKQHGDTINPLIQAAGNAGNKLFDACQAKLQNNLENFGSDDVKGLWKLIPKKIRQAASGFTKGIADDITNIGDAIQAGINKKFQKVESAPVANAQVDSEVSAEVQEYAMMLAELQDMRTQAALDALRANIRAEVTQVMSSDEMLSAVPVEQRGLFKLLANLTQPLVNQIYDKAQSKFINNLKNFGSDNVTGLMALIPKNIRQATSGIASALADPLDKLADKIQGKLQDASQKIIEGKLNQAPKK